MHFFSGYKMSDANLGDKTADSTSLDESVNANNDEDASMNDTTQPLDVSIDNEKKGDQQEKKITLRRSLRNSKEDVCYFIFIFYGSI